MSCHYCGGTVCYCTAADERDAVIEAACAVVDYQRPVFTDPAVEALAVAVDDYYAGIARRSPSGTGEDPK